LAGEARLGAVRSGRAWFGKAGKEEFLIYRFKKARRIKGVSAQKAGERIAELRERFGGGITPTQIVDEARRKTSPIHNAFEWSDTKAAEAYRLVQARMLIGAIVIVRDGSEPDEPKIIQANVSVNTESGRKYVSIQRAMSEAQLREQVLDEAYEDLQDWRKRYNSLKEFASVFDAIDYLPNRKHKGTSVGS
jgi:hypothetical protein